MNAELADRIIKVMLETKYAESKDISKVLQENHESVRDMMSLLLAQYSTYFQSTKGSGYSDSIHVFIRPSQIATMKAFLTQGGFTAQFKKGSEQETREEYKRELEIVQLEEATSRAKRAEMVSCVSAVIAAIAVILEIGRSCNWWK